MYRVVVLLLIVVAVSVECRAQKNIPQEADTTKYWRVQTNDDNEFIGRIIHTENGVITLDTEKFGVITVRFVDVRSISEADPHQKVGGNQYGTDNFQTTRYFFMPNGYGLKPGEGYYQNVWILVNQFSVGVTENFSVSVGTLPIFLFGADIIPYWLNGKFSVPLGEKVHMGAGLLYFSTLNLGSKSNGSGSAGLAYGTLTLGSRDRNASLGVGYGFSRGDFSKRPVVTFASMTRLGPRSYLLTENYLFGLGKNSGAVGLLSFGGRRLIKKMGVDFGGFIPVGGGVNRLITIPWLGLTAPLGKRYGIR